MNLKRCFGYILTSDASPLEILERETRFELATPTLARSCSTAELFPLFAMCNSTLLGNFVKFHVGFWEKEISCGKTLLYALPGRTLYSEYILGVIRKCSVFGYYSNVIFRTKSQSPLAFMWIFFTLLFATTMFFAYQSGNSGNSLLIISCALM